MTNKNIVQLLENFLNETILIIDKYKKDTLSSVKQGRLHLKKIQVFFGEQTLIYYNIFLNNAEHSSG